MGDQLYLECLVWIGNAARRERYSNANNLEEYFKIAPKTAQRSIVHFRDRLQAPLMHDKHNKLYYHNNPTYQLPAIRISKSSWHPESLTRRLSL